MSNNQTAHGYVRSESISDEGKSIFIAIEKIDYTLVTDDNGMIQGIIFDQSILKVDEE
jgi:hypothetical protein